MSLFRLAVFFIYLWLSVGLRECMFVLFCKSITYFDIVIWKWREKMLRHFDIWRPFCELNTSKLEKDKQKKQWSRPFLASTSVAYILIWANRLSDFCCISIVKRVTFIFRLRVTQCSNSIMVNFRCFPLLLAILCPARWITSFRWKNNWENVWNIYSMILWQFIQESHITSIPFNIHRMFSPPISLWFRNHWFCTGMSVP